MEKVEELLILHQCRITNLFLFFMDKQHFYDNEAADDVRCK